MARRSRLRGDKEIRQVLRGLPVAIRKEILDVLEELGAGLETKMKAAAPKRTGALRAGITHKVFPLTLRMEVGLRDTKRGRSDLFYGRIQDLGRRRTIAVIERRIRRDLPGMTRPYPRDTPAMPGKRFITGRYTEARQEAREKLKGIYARAMTTAGSGVRSVG